MSDALSAETERLLRLAEGATPGPWEWENDQMFGPHIECVEWACGDGYHFRKPIIQTDSGVYGPHGKDKDLIAAVPEMIEHIRALSERLARVEAEERERCAKVVEHKAESIRRVNTYRGKVDRVSTFAADMVDEAAAAIRAGK